MALASSSWPKFHGNLKNTGRSPFQSITDGTVKWAFNLVNNLDVGFNSPVIGINGVIYIGEASTDIGDPGGNVGLLYAINPDGTQKWRSAKVGLIPKSTPAIDDTENIYTSFSQFVRKVNSSGGTVWEVFNRATFNGRISLVDVAGVPRLYSNSAELSIRGVTALKTSDGSQIWNVLSTTHIYSGPAVADDGTIYFGATDLYAYNPDGSQKWSLVIGGISRSTPAIGSDGTIYIGSTNGNLYAVTDNGGSGSIKWSFSTGGAIDSSPAIGSDGTIYIGSDDGKLYAITDNGASGSQKWAFTTGGAVQSSPAVSANNIIYVGSNDSKFYAINSDGSQKWVYNGSGTIQSSPAIGSDGTVYVAGGGIPASLIAFQSVSAVSNIAGRPTFRSRGAGVQSGIVCGKGKRRR